MLERLSSRTISTQTSWKEAVRRFHSGGIRRRLLMWGLSLFGLALSIAVIAGYFYMVEQIRRDAAALQSELATVTAERIRKDYRNFSRYFYIVK